MTPRFPGADTRTGAVLACLIRGQDLTSLDAWRRCHTSRAAAAIESLRLAGWPIVTKLVRARGADGRQSHIARYTLSPAAIEKLGDEARAFLRAVETTRRNS